MCSCFVNDDFKEQLELLYINMIDNALCGMAS